MPSTFDIAIEKTLAHEGGYVNDPADSGGETNFGISKRAYPHLDIAALTRNQAIAVYRNDYWTTPGIDQIKNPTLAAKLFDLGVNMGISRAVKLLQQSINWFGSDLVADGILGPATASTINAFPHPKALLMALKIEAGNYFIKLGKHRFLAGWLNRLAE